MEENSSQLRDLQRPVHPQTVASWSPPDLGKEGPADALNQLASEQHRSLPGNGVAGGSSWGDDSAIGTAEFHSYGGNVGGHFSGFNTTYQDLLGFVMSGGNVNGFGMGMMHTTLNAEAPIFGMESQGHSLQPGLNYVPLPEAPQFTHVPLQQAPRCANTDTMSPVFPYDLNAPPMVDASSSGILGVSDVSASILTELQKASTISEENFDPEKALDGQIDLSKPPGRKPRKKKHRPKVVVEGKKPRNPRPTNLNGVEMPKRKYVRKNSVKKPVDGPLEGETNGVIGEAQIPAAEVEEKNKRKRVRQKNVDQSPTPLKDGNTTQAPRRSRLRSSKKSLNFNNESQEEEGGVCNQPTDSTSARTGRRTPRKSLNFGIESQVADFEIRYSEGKTVLVEKTKGDACELTQFVQAAPSEYPFVKESRAHTATSCLSSQFDVGNAKRSTGIGFSEQTQAREPKRTRLSTTYAMDPSNMIGAGSCSVLAYQQVIMPTEYSREQISNMNFPAVYENQRGATFYQSASSSIAPTSFPIDCYTTNHVYPSDDKAFQSSSTAQIMANDSKSLPAVGIAGKITRKRSKGITRARKTQSLLEAVSQSPTSGNGKGALGGSQGPHACMEALANFSRTLARKKRSNRIVFGSSSVSNDHHRSATELYGVHAGYSQDAIGRGKSMIDAIIEHFSYLSIEGRSSHINYQEANAWQNSIVLYQNNGAMVPFDSQFNQLRKRKPRPKVELDEETTKVWKLLLEDINSEGVDGTDEQKAKWWRDEREVFRLRTESFIARMHLVQGDRRFTPWKGSVVDSVVGVFLTQNVSDHLSSSAFISMAARFPLKSRNIHDESPLSEKRSEGPEVVEPNEAVEWSKEESSPVARIHGSVTLPDQKCSEEEINTRIFLGSSSEGTKTSCLSSLSSFASGCGTKLNNEAGVNRYGSQDNKMRASLTGDQRESNYLISSQNSVASHHYSMESIAQIFNRCDSSSQSSTEADLTDAASTRTSFVELLQMAGAISPGNYNPRAMKTSSFLESPINSKVSCNSQDFNLGSQGTITSEEGSRFFGVAKEIELSATEQSGSPPESSAGASCQNSLFQNLHVLKEGGDDKLASRVQKQEAHRLCEGSNAPSSSESEIDNSGKRIAVEIEKNQKGVGSNPIDSSNPVGTAEAPDASKENKRKTNGKQKKDATDWDSLRKQAEANGKRERTRETMDSVDWERVRCADVNEIAYTIRERGMNNMLAERIKDFLNRIVREHGSIDLEWLRDIEPDRAKEYLLSVRGLGLKSVECVRLLTLHHLAFPVDTNVGRIAVRLGWVPLQPLPESLQLHLLELYPVLETIQKYLWPRLCKLDQPTLYELHYQLITFGKVFCTKNKPNCNACPMRAECRHFASAYASARLALPAPEERSIITVTQDEASNKNASENNVHQQLPQPETIHLLEAMSQIRSLGPIIEEPATPEPIIEEPASPEPETLQPTESDIEESVHEHEIEIPEIMLNLEELNQNLQDYMQMHIQVQDSENSKALVVVDAKAASIPMPKLKSINRLRTEHQVYELPDTHPLLQGFDRREPDDPSPYLLAIWTPGETVDSIKPPESTCSCFQDSGKLCDQVTCFSCNSIREANNQTVRGTLLIPCRTAMRGSFPLNGTYFQVNEMFADHESSLNPIAVPRDWLWKLPRRMVYFGTSVPSIFKGLTQPEIQFCFWKGFVCVRGFDKRARAPRPLIARLHFPASKLNKTGEKTEE